MTDAAKRGKKLGGAGGFFNQNDSMHSPSVTDRRYSQQKQQFVPCTTAIISHATYNPVDSSFSYQSYQLVNVVLTGHIVSVQENPTCINYEFSDSTSPNNITVRKWFEDRNQDTKKLSFCREDSFVRVLGHMRQIENDRLVIAFTILPIIKLDEITYHLLDVIHSHLLLPKLQLNDSVHSHQDNSYNTTYAASGVGTRKAIGGATLTESENQFGGWQSGGGGLNPLSRQILDVMRLNTKDRIGMHHKDIKRQLRNVDDKIFRETLEFLFSEGHVYTTVDEDHYQVTDSC